MFKSFEALMMDARAVLNGETDLHKAARQGDTAKLKALLLAGADVHCKDPHGYFRLHHVHFVDRAGRRAGLGLAIR
jgi:ankyrin repeat protein